VGNSLCFTGSHAWQRRPVLSWFARPTFVFEFLFLFLSHNCEGFFVEGIVWVLIYNKENLLWAGSYTIPAGVALFCVDGDEIIA
jgi:hypothetical protein